MDFMRWLSLLSNERRAELSSTYPIDSFWDYIFYSDLDDYLIQVKQYTGQSGENIIECPDGATFTTNSKLDKGDLFIFLSDKGAM